mgnify:CR=1 FL=1
MLGISLPELLIIFGILLTIAGSGLIAVFIIYTASKSSDE